MSKDMTNFYYLCSGCKKRLDTTTEEAKQVYECGFPLKVVCGNCGCEHFMKIPRKNPRKNPETYQPTAV